MAAKVGDQGHGASLVIDPAVTHQPTSIFHDIRAWLLLAFLLRLIGITEAPVETTHGWRQAFTNMVARNLAEGPFDLLHPRTSMAGERADVVACEFPAFNALVAVTYRAFGPAHWYGRLLALLMVTAGTWAFHGVMRRALGERVAFHATFLLLWSSMFLYGRKSMPDAFAVGLMLLAIATGDLAQRRHGNGWLMLTAALTALAGLCKIPVVVLAPIWVLFAWRHGSSPRWKATTLAALLLASAPVVAWYFIWQPHLLHAYGNQLYFPVPVPQGLRELAAYGMDTFQRFAFSALLGYLPFAACVAGLMLVVGRRLNGLALMCLIVALPFLYFMARAGSVFALHGYYVLPMVPLMALLAGMATSTVPDRRIRALALALCVVEGVGLRWSDLRPGDERRFLLRAEDLADRTSMPTEPVATSGDLDPRAMYFLHRHGWSLPNDRLLDRTTLDSLASLGLRTVYVDRHVLAAPLPWVLVHEDADWSVYRRPADLSH